MNFRSPHRFRVYRLVFNFRSDSRTWRCWSIITCFSGWKKFIVYSPMGVVPIIWPHKLWLSYVAGGQLLMLSFCHLTLSFKCGRSKRRRKNRLLNAEADSFERYVYHNKHCDQSLILCP